MAYSEKVIDHYENPATSATGTTADVKTRKDIGVGVVGARVWRRHATQIRSTRAARSKTPVQVLRLRLDHRQFLARHRVDQGQDPRRGHGHQNTDLVEETASARQDPLLGPRRGLDQSHQGLPEEERPAQGRTRARPLRRRQTAFPIRNKAGRVSASGSRVSDVDPAVPQDRPSSGRSFPGREAYNVRESRRRMNTRSSCHR